MLSSAKIGTASWRYYTGAVACRATEYYLGVGEAPGRWHGHGLVEFGLEPRAVVNEAQLEALFARALHPTTGQRLGRAWRTDGVTGFDLTFSAPKSVSSLWALGDRDVATAAMDAHRAAVTAGLAYLDTHAGLSRRGTDGTEQIGTEGLAVALFDHRTSRCGDPQLHTHALVVNKVRCTDGIWRTLDATELFHHKKSAGMIYQTALRNELHLRLGVAFEAVNEHGQAEIAGVPQELLKLWSKRTAQIDADAAPRIAEYESVLGRSLTAAERIAVVKTAVLKTRPGKDHPELSALNDLWATEAGAFGITPAAAVEAVRAAASGRLVPGAEVGTELLLGAVQASGRVRAVFSRADVAGQVAALLRTDGLTAAEALARVEELTDQALALTEAVSVGEHPKGLTARASDGRWASAEVLAAEARVLGLAEQGRQGGYGQVPGLTLAVSLMGRGLDAGQYDAARHLAGSGDFLCVLTAPAGAGKTRTLGAATAAWEAVGFRVIGLAPSARAAAELGSATGGRADTLAKWLHNHTRLRTLPEAERAWAIPDDRTVVIVDEASMASTLDLDRLISVAARCASKVVLVGDPAQIGVINGPGGMLAALANAGHGIELASIHRFTHDWEKDASQALRTGDPDILASYAAAGRLHPCPDGDQGIDAVHEHWAAARADGQDVLMMARTRADVDALNHRARAAEVAAYRIAGPINHLGERDWQAGDLLRTRRNDRRLPIGDGHVRNGDGYWVIDAHGPGGGLIVSDLAGRGRTVLPADYVAAHAEYGWATTIDGAQGATTDTGIVLVRPGLDREHLYVAMTRGRHANHAYITPDPTAEPNHHGPAHAGPSGERAPADQALDVLTAALATSGAQDAAHTARDAARSRAAEQARKESERTVAAQRQAAPVMPPDHATRIALLAQRRAEAEQLGADQNRHRQQLRQANDELAHLPRWSRARRATLTAVVSDHETALAAAPPVQARLRVEIDQLSRDVERDSRDRQDLAKQAETRRLGRALSTRLASGLARPRPIITAGPHQAERDALAHRLRQNHYDRERSRERARDDDRGLSR
ncbi:MAG: MobF family relaxase [Sporichthyaceae bacterium]